MNEWFCPDCFRRSEKESNIKVVQCGCGEYMIINKEGGDDAE